MDPSEPQARNKKGFERMAAQLDFIASKVSNAELRQSQEASEAMAMVRHIEQFASGEAPNASAKLLKIFTQEAQAEGSSKSPSPSLVSYGSFMSRNDSRPDRASHPRTQDPLQRATGKARPETFKPGRERKTSVASATPKVLEPLVSPAEDVGHGDPLLAVWHPVPLQQFEVRVVVVDGMHVDPILPFLFRQALELAVSAIL